MAKSNLDSLHQILMKKNVSSTEITLNQASNKWLVISKDWVSIIESGNTLKQSYILVDRFFGTECDKLDHPRSKHKSCQNFGVFRFTRKSKSKPG